jgi:hypothetical protein
MVLKHLTSAILFFYNAPLSPFALRSCLPTYWLTLLPVLLHLQKLQLGWADPIELLAHQLSLSALQQLTGLSLAGRRGKSDRGAGGNAVGPEQVVQLVQGATQLQEVSLYRPLTAGSSKDQLVLGLQGALPRLRLLILMCGPQELGPATQAALRQGLFVRDYDCMPADSEADDE